MTEITRVPLLPIARGALGKLWLGAIVAVAAGAGLAWATMPALVSVKTETAGEGASPTISDVAIVKLRGTLKDGTEFQPEALGPLPLGKMIPGFTKALLQMQRGGKYQVMIPASLGYGDQANGMIPPNSDLYFDVEVLEFMSAEQFQMQQMRQQMQGQGGPGGPGGQPAPEGAAPTP